MPMINATRHFPGGNGTGPRGAFAITPSDSADLPFLARAIWVGVGGTLVVQMSEGNPQTYLNVPEGRFEGDIIRVHATGTTATNLIGLY